MLISSLEKRPVTWLRLSSAIHLAAILCLGLAFAENLADGLVIATGLTLALVSLLAPLASTSRTADAEPAALPEPAPAAPTLRVPSAGQTAAATRPAPPLVSALRRAGGDPRQQAWADLMGRVSHELRTPLNAVLGFSDIMGRELFGPVGNARYHEYVRHINECGRELLKSAEDTLALTAILADPKRAVPGEPVNLAQLAEEAFGFFSSTVAARGLWLDLHLPPGLEVIAERRALRQILINLLSEAIARSGDHAGIILKAGAAGDMAQIEMQVEDTRGERPVDSLAVCLARALLELLGSSLIEMETRAEGWRAITLLGIASQQDFFAAPPMLRHHRAMDCVAA